MSVSTAAILRDRPEINQTTERKEGGFLRQIRSHLFRPLTRAGLASVLGIRNPPTVPAPIPSSSGPYPALSVAYGRDDVQDVGCGIQPFEGRAQDVRGDVHDVGDKVQDVDDRVQDIGKHVSSRVQGVDDELDQANRSSSR